MALPGLAKKAKEAEVAQLKAQLLETKPDSPIFKYLEQGKTETDPDPPDALTNRLYKKKGNLSVIAEYRRVLKSGFVKDILEPELISPMIRDGGAQAMALSTDKATGGVTQRDIERVVLDQERAKGMFPPPLPLIIKDNIVDEFQIAWAKDSGAIAVTLSPSLVGTDRCRELYRFACNIDVESVFQCTNEEEVKWAAKLGANLIAIVGKGVDEAIELSQHIPDDSLKIVHVDRRSDEGLDEIEDCWILRDAGINVIWVCEVLYKGGQFQAESVQAVLKAMRSKASTKYARARGMSGKGEGSKEFLGNIFF